MVRAGLVLLLASVTVGCLHQRKPVVPNVKPYTVKSDLSNVRNAAGLKDVTPRQREILAAQGFVVTDGSHKDFYEAYVLNPAPFVSTDSVLHAYLTLVNDTLVSTWEVKYGPSVVSLFEQAGEILAKDRSDAGRLASAYVAHALSSIPDRSASAEFSVSEIENSGFSPPTSLYPFLAQLRTQPIPFDTDEGLRACLTLSVALQDCEAYPRYLEFLEFSRKLAGAPEDPGPPQVSEILPKLSIASDLETTRNLSREQCLSVRNALKKFSHPRVADQGQSEAIPGLRLLPPGVTAKSLAFQDVFQKEMRVPTGQDIVRLLDSGKALEPDSTDLHSRCLGVLRQLPKSGAEGYPSFCNSDNWSVKRQNTQLGAWAELEHAVAPLTKDNSSYLGGYENELSFHGYVEPAPEFYRALRELVAWTRTEFRDDLASTQAHHEERSERLRQFYGENIDKFRRSLSVRLKDVDEVKQLLGGIAPIPTAEHFEKLETTLEYLEEISQKELDERPFSSEEVNFLANYGETLKYLSLNETNIPKPPEPSGVVVAIAEEHSQEIRRYAATGRPLRIVVVVPYKGALFWSEGAIYSYYEFDRPLSTVISDADWKEVVRASVSIQPDPPLSDGPRSGAGKKRVTREDLPPAIRRMPDHRELHCVVRERENFRRVILAVILLVVFFVACAPSSAQSGDAVNKRIEQAISADFSTVKKILQLSQSLDSAEPQTEEGIDQWVQQAQTVRLEMIELAQTARDSRIETLSYLKEIEAGVDCPLKDLVIDYFEGENAYFSLAKEAQDGSSVMVFKSNSLSDQERARFEELGKLGDALLTSYDTMLKSQDRLLAKAKEQGLPLDPVWDPAEQRETLDSYRAMKNFTERLRND